ncbi:MAG: hypothetical protein Q9174_003564 [Haloplaca sp. 1 TL-2023]
MALDNNRQISSRSLPAPTEPAYQSHSRGESRQSSRQGWYSPFPPTSNTQQASQHSQQHSRNDSHGHGRGDSQDNAGDDRGFAMDAKRFTPNLHASLVSEILSLRRDIESKDRNLTSLEESLHNAKLDNGQLSATVTSQEREIKSAKKELQLLENGTLSALGDLAKERDDVAETLADVKKRLEISKNTNRAQEEEARRNQALWEQDKQSWDNEKRNIERKVHVAEGRLKTMINEVAAAQTNNRVASMSGSEMEEGAGETWFSNWSDIISTRSSSVRGRYHLSEFSNNTYDTNELANLRNSAVARCSISGGPEPNSLSLADELNFDEEVDDDNGGSELQNEVISPDALPEENPFRSRRMSVQSQDYKARKILGLSSESKEHSPVKNDQHPSPIDEKPLPPLHLEKESEATYKDADTQVTPPPSPKTMAQGSEAVFEKDFGRGTVIENTANQSRKRTSIPALSQDAVPSKLEPAVCSTTASASCQTNVLPISPPLVPMIALEPMFPEPSSISKPMMISSSTQTDGDSRLGGESASSRPQSSSNTVPVIAIHPPGSRPGSSYNHVVLPPRTKNASCQTTPSTSGLKSVAVQTESIRVDKRPLKIPPRLMPAAAPSKPPSQSGQIPRKPMPKATKVGFKSPPPVEPPRIRGRPADIKTKPEPIVSLQGQGGSRKQARKPASPVKLDNPFAGFSDPEGPERDVDFSDDDDFANVAPIRKTLSKVQNSWKLVPASVSAGQSSRPLGRPISDIQEVDDTEAGASDMQSTAEQKQRIAPHAKQGGQDARPITAIPPPNIRKAALISNGALAHLRQRSGSEPGPSTAVQPPFPVPTRSSSRKLPVSTSEGNGSPTPHTTSFITGVRNRSQVQPQSRNPLRKVRSAAAVPKFARNPSKQGQLHSPTVTSPGSTPLASPRLPWVSRGDNSSQQSSSLSQPLEYEGSSSGSRVPDAASESPIESTSVVDAIAQTMVGEWLWKYVRKRKSFGIADSPQVEFDEGRNQTEGNSGTRHKRWVWLAPYERTIMWSSKQPTNGSALMGKGGRKLTIQSVVDVRDNTPLPKGSGLGNVPGRSILILTPQRALKFTASSLERHYVWLTALSFLSHSSLGLDELATVPPVPQAEYQQLYPQISSGARRSPRDSLKLAKVGQRPALQARNITAPTANVRNDAVARGTEHDDVNESVSDAAEPPQIPRVSTHNRKRSNTGPRPSLQSAFNSFPAHRGSFSSAPNAKPPTQRDISTSVTRGFHGLSSRPTSMTRHMSETAPPQPEPVRNDFFDAVGTVRMEAFVDKTESRMAAASKPAGSYRTRQGRKKDMSYWGIMNQASSEDVAAPQVAKSKPTWRSEDPFQGF